MNGRMENEQRSERSQTVAALDEGAFDFATREAIVFIGDTLAPFFLEDPEKGSAGPLYAAFAGLDVSEAADEWPFADSNVVRDALDLMVGALSNDARGDVEAGALAGESHCASTSGGADQELVWEYRRLFVGPGSKPAPPWGSVYTDRDGVIFGRSTLDLREWMRENGIERLAGDGDPDDHIGLLLKMMSWIARQRPDLLDEFLRLHLLTWSSHYLEKLHSVTEHPFFRGLALLAESSLEGIRSQCGIEVDYPRYYR